MTIIYLLECKNDDDVLYKIGSTKKSVKSRISKLQTGNPFKIKEVANFTSFHGQKVEKILHNNFSYCKKNGEWFSLNISDVSNFINTCQRIENGLNLIENFNYF